MEQDKRGMTVVFTDGSKMSLNFPRQSANDVAAGLKIDDVLKKRYVLLEADGTLLMIPFENVRYFQLYPAPKTIPHQTYIKGASVLD
jgi:hypothetical protein